MFCDRFILNVDTKDWGFSVVVVMVAVVTVVVVVVLFSQFGVFALGVLQFIAVELCLNQPAFLQKLQILPQRGIRLQDFLLLAQKPKRLYPPAIPIPLSLNIHKPEICAKHPSHGLLPPLNHPLKEIRLFILDIAEFGLEPQLTLLQTHSQRPYRRLPERAQKHALILHIQKTYIELLASLEVDPALAVVDELT